MENSCLTHDSSASDCLKAVLQISGNYLPNYKGEMIDLASIFKDQPLGRELNNYHDRHMVNLVKFGFPLEIQDRDKQHRGYINNHTSAREFIHTTG